MQIRFDYSERINTDKLIESIENFIEFSRDGFKFDIFCNNDICVSIINEQFRDDVNISIYKRNADSLLEIVRISFFNNLKTILDIYEETNFIYSKKDKNKYIKDLIMIVKTIYVKDKILVIT